MFVHLPGWERLGHAVLDIVESEGVDPGATVLCHMNPSWTDQGYQRSLADRGSWLEYDMVGMDYYYADQQAQSPCDEENAQAICGLLEAGYRRLLVSSDTFLKMMLKRYGGFGYAHVPTNFAARLRRHGLREDVVRGLMEEHPRRLFETACAAAAQND
jgi:phosphotriesterase-related protein